MPWLNRNLPLSIKAVVFNERTDPPPGLPPLASFEVHSPRVARLLAGNPGRFTLHGTNCYIVGRGPSRTLIDCGEGRACFEPALREALRVLDCSISRVLITHRHFDHTGGLDQVRRVCGESVEVRKLVRDEFKFDPGRYNAVRSVDCGYASSLVDGERIQVDSETTLRVWHTPGHCEDHCCFVLEEERALFSGDNVLGCGSSWFENLATYMQTLATMLEVSRKEQLERLYPGHGPPNDRAAATIEEYVSHRSLRETQIIAALSAPAESSSWWSCLANSRTSLQLVFAVYDRLPPYLVFAAQHNVHAHLEKLEREGLVLNCSRDLWALKPKPH